MISLLTVRHRFQCLVSCDDSHRAELAATAPNPPKRQGRVTSPLTTLEEIALVIGVCKNKLPHQTLVTVRVAVPNLLSTPYEGMLLLPILFSTLLDTQRTRIERGCRKPHVLQVHHTLEPYGRLPFHLRLRYHGPSFSGN